MHMSRFIPVTGALKICHPSDGSVDIMPNLWDFFLQVLPVANRASAWTFDDTPSERAFSRGGENNLRILI